jgi:hypothetical protein
MRLMMTIGASSIARIDPERTALGQFPARDLVFGNVWQYYSENGPTRYQNLIKGGGTDPTIRSGSDTTARLNWVARCTRKASVKHFHPPLQMP